MLYLVNAHVPSFSIPTSTVLLRVLLPSTLRPSAVQRNSSPAICSNSEPERKPAEWARELIKCQSVNNRLSSIDHNRHHSLSFLSPLANSPGNQSPHIVGLATALQLPIGASHIGRFPTTHLSEVDEWMCYMRRGSIQ